ncbi:MAG TPA: hypothetical protein VIJ77_07245 [Candidatus Tumulicola sp.]
MMPIYVGVVVLIALVALFFGGRNWLQHRTLQAAMATPSPGPNASAKPIALADGGSVGALHFKTGNAPAGGSGQPIDGISCLTLEGQALHIHSHLALFDNGKQIQIPRFIGFAMNQALPGGGCLYWIHTHDTSGIIHVETPEIHAPNGGQYTLGMLFAIWGQPLGPDAIAGFKGPVTAYVNGAKYDGDLHAIPLAAHQQITLEVGSPTVPPPNYVFPPND